MTRRKAAEDKKVLYNHEDISRILEEAAAQFDYEHVYWLSDEDYAKAVGQLKMQAAGIFDFMKVDERLPVRYMYGLGEGIPGATKEIVKLCEDFGLRVRGIDKEISLEIIRRKQWTTKEKDDNI